MPRSPLPAARALACATLLALSAGCGGGGGRAAEAPAPPASGKPRADAPALRVPVSALATYLAERKAREAGKARAGAEAARAELSADRESRVDRAIGEGTRLLAENRPAEAAAALRAVAGAEDLPPAKRAEALFPLAQALAASGDAAGAAEARRTFDACMKRAIEEAREAEARDGFAGLLLGHEITAKEGGDPEKFLQDAQTPR